MKDYVELGPVPCNEDCQQLGSPSYDPVAAKAECRRFIDLIRATVGEPPDGASLIIKSNSHDFGTYYEVAVRYDDENETAADYAWHCESNCPSRWNGEGAKKWTSPAPLVHDQAFYDNHPSVCAPALA